MQRTPAIAGPDDEIYESPHSSLSQRLVALRDRLDSHPVLIGEIYDALYLKHFGVPSRRKRSTTNNLAFGRVFAWCLNHEVAVADYIAANMLLLRDRYPLRAKSGRVINFTPGVLVGSKAEARYNGVLRRANSRHRQGTTDVFDATETWLGRIRSNLFQAEYDVAEVFVSAHLDGRSPSWRDVSGDVETNQDWRDFYAGRGAFASVANSYSRERAVTELMFAQLRAAWCVAEGVQHGLADRVGFSDFNWPDFSRLMCYVRDQRPKRERVDVTPHSGSSWGKW